MFEYSKQNFQDLQEKNIKPSAKITIYFAFFNYIYFQVVQRADARDLLGAQSPQLTFTNITPSK